MDPMLVGGIAGAVAAVVAVGLYAVLQKPKDCPQCGTPAPKVRKPANRREMLWGGWTCQKCGCELDRRGRKVNPRDE
jgi:transposase-like protein